MAQDRLIRATERLDAAVARLEAAASAAGAEPGPDPDRAELSVRLDRAISRVEGLITAEAESASQANGDDE